MSFTPSEVVLGATLPLENGSTITFSIAGHVEAERDYDDAAVIFGRKLLKYTNCATDADRLTVRQVVASITSTPLDKVPDVGTPTPPPPVMSPAPTVAEQTATAPDPAPSAPPTPEASVSGAPQSGEVCANCGAAVSASQAKLSQLFQSKTLCKSCMEAP
jgi:hypothetical protein